MWRHLAPVRTAVSQERIASIIRVERIILNTAKFIPSSQIFYPDDGGDTFLRNVGS
jgi:hypothetical protein